MREIGKAEQRSVEKQRSRGEAEQRRSAAVKKRSSGTWRNGGAVEKWSSGEAEKRSSRAVKKRSSGEAEKQSYDNTIFILFSSIGLTLTFSLLSLIPGNFHFPLQFPIPPLPNLYSLKLNPNFSFVLDTCIHYSVEQLLVKWVTDMHHSCGRMINADEKEKVVAAAWGTEFIQFLATLFWSRNIWRKILIQ